MNPDRLEQQMRFLIEIDKLKHVFRQTLLMDASRYENDAEHSWHLALMAILLSEHAAEQQLDTLRVLKMLLIHDLVEIDAGDTFCYDKAGNRDKAAREQKAADRLFAMLPHEQGPEVRALWDEFEAGRTPEARFAGALDRLHPMLHNYQTRGAAWRKHGVRKKDVLDRNRAIEQGSPALWEYAKRLVEESVRKGFLCE
ncbi:MAG: HD domain-containing protein [Kiritimatiellae bacterium]|nr:HD domain-containing protein [Kiritimatiellia bacterium]